MSTMTLMQTPCEETYEDVQNLLYKISHRFKAKYGGEFEDLFSQANEHYLAAYNSYDSNRTKFSTWLWFTVWHAMLETMRNAARKHGQCPRDYSIELTTVSLREQFDLQTFIRDVSEDAATVVKLLFECPHEISEAFAPSKVRISSIRTNLVNRLLSMGWAGKRIACVFQEIKEALQS